MSHNQEKAILKCIHLRKSAREICVNLREKYPADLRR